MITKYEIQTVFVVVVGYILYEGWTNRDEWFVEGQEAEAEAARYKNVWRGIRSVVLLMFAVGFINPYVDRLFPRNTKIWRIGAEICKLYLYFLAFVYSMNT